MPPLRDSLDRAAADLAWPGRTQAEQARRRVHAKVAARDAYPNAAHFATAFLKGWHARLTGRGRDANPYKGATHGKRRNYVGSRSRGAVQANGTFTFAWRAAWTRGWDDARI